MKADLLLESLTDVRDDYITEAAPRGRRKKRGWVKWAALAACLCLLCAGGIGLRLATALPPITLPYQGYDTLGCYDPILYHSAEELQTSLSMEEAGDFPTLPVYRNGCYDPSGAGEPRGLTEEEMRARLEAAAAALGVEIRSVEEERREEGQGEGEIGALFCLQGSTERGRIRVDADGGWVLVGRDFLFDPYVSADVSPEERSMEALTVPEEYRDAPPETREEAQALLDALAEEYGDFLEFENPEGMLLFRRPEYLEVPQFLSYEYLVYDKSGDPVRDLLSYSLCPARINLRKWPEASDLQVTSIHREDYLEKAEKLGDYPVLSRQEAREALLAGEYFTRVPERYCDFDPEDIVMVSLGYPGNRLEEYLQPVYCFYVALPEETVEPEDRPEDGLTADRNVKPFGCFYVPAVRPEYFSQDTAFDDYR